MSKKKKYRGSGTHGGGSKKKRRGAGSRGGRGRSGEKHKKLKYMKERNEEKGFTRPERKDVKTINLKELDSRINKLLEEGKVESEGEEIKVNLSELGYDKLLGSGKISETLIVEAENFSERAKEKLEESGGKAIEIS